MKTSDLINTGSKILKEKNIPTHRIDSEIILSHILKKDRERILINEYEITKNQFEIFNRLLTRRLNNEPIAYIINKKEFRSNNLYVAKNSLIPRPETELLIDPIISIFKRRKLYFLDAGIGTGCIIFSILNELKYSKGVGIDICNKAISVAKINLKNFKFSQRVKIQNRSIDQIFNKKFDLVVSNPPYVVKREINQLSDDIKKFEPKKALNGGNDGLDVIRKVIYKSRYILKINGILALEIGRGQYLSVLSILKKNKFKQIKIIKDYKDNVRCIFSTLL
tara:strand:+ start:1656 stop:2492 length:837 start_codon:yes stop_codon:yes gene_type:complete